MTGGRGDGLLMAFNPALALCSCVPDNLWEMLLLMGAILFWPVLLCGVLAVVIAATAKRPPRPKLPQTPEEDDGL
jgi:hypothetical protein